MNDEARKLFEELGSTVAKELAFRDSWVFVGAKGIENKSPFEQVRSVCKVADKYIWDLWLFNGHWPSLWEWPTALHTVFFPFQTYWTQTKASVWQKISKIESAVFLTQSYWRSCFLGSIVTGEVVLVSVLEIYWESIHGSFHAHVKITLYVVPCSEWKTAKAATSMKAGPSLWKWMAVFLCGRHCKNNCRH